MTDCLKVAVGRLFREVEKKQNYTKYFQMTLGTFRIMLPDCRKYFQIIYESLMNVLKNWNVRSSWFILNIVVCQTKISVDLYFKSTISFHETTDFWYNWLNFTYSFPCKLYRKKKKKEITSVLIPLCMLKMKFEVTIWFLKEELINSLVYSPVYDDPWVSPDYEGSLSAKGINSQFRYSHYTLLVQRR